MKVAITGATGFVGSHATAAILARGHQVRLLARQAGRVPATFAPLGVEPPSDVVVGDVTDPEVVRALLDGCDAVVHAASIFSMDPRSVPSIERTNVAGTELVLGTAASAGMGAIVHLSSIAAFLPSRDRVVDGESSLGTGTDAYARSKARSEAIARRIRGAGAPVTSILPGGVLGPHDPYLGELDAACQMMLTGKMPLLPRGAVSPLVDVRDLAHVVVRGLEAGRPGSYAVAPYRPSIRQMVRHLEELTERRLPNVPIPDTVARSVGRIADLVQRIVPADIPIRGATMRELTAMPVIDNTPAIHALGFAPRPLDETLVDTVRWLARAGHITREEAGRLAPDPIIPA